MKRIRIDFAPRSFLRAAIRTRGTTWLFGCIGFILCASAGVVIVRQVQQRDALVAAAEKIQIKLQDSAKRKSLVKKVAIPDAQALAVNSAIGQLNLPWRDLLDAMEDATPASVALLSLDPDPRKHQVNGMAEAKSAEGMIAYIAQLKRQPFFGNVVLTKHEINDRDPNKPLRFQFEAEWKEAAK